MEHMSRGQMVKALQEGEKNRLELLLRIVDLRKSADLHMEEYNKATLSMDNSDCPPKKREMKKQWLECTWKAKDGAIRIEIEAKLEELTRVGYTCTCLQRRLQRMR